MSIRLFGALSVLCAVMGFVVASPNAAEASPSHQDCKFQGEVLEITANTSGATPTVTLKLKITALEESLFMANPCAAVGSEATFEIDNDAQAIDDKITRGDVIMLDTSAYDALGPDGHISERSSVYKGRVESDPATTPPSKPPSTTP
jgi:3-deoxy-D-arabino-heptulosonate 7-phosphate (DAHP) synthase